MEIPLPRSWGLCTVRIATLLCMLLATTFVASRNAASQDVVSQNASNTPGIRVTTRLVQINVVVHDKNGPVSNLEKDDFVVLDRRKPRKISIFSVESADSVPQTAPSLPQDTFSNLPQYGASAPRSITIVLLDNLNTLSGSAPAPYESTPYWMEDLALANAKAHLIAFVQQLDPLDRVAIYGLTDSVHVLCDFTSDRSELLAILKKYDTSSKTSREAVDPGAFHTPVPGVFNRLMGNDTQAFGATINDNRAQETMAALQTIAAHVANIPGRKNLVWLTANLPFSGTAMARVLSPAQIAAYPIDARGLLNKEPLRDVSGIMDGDAAARGDFAPAQSPQPIGIAAMRQMADQTGGRAFVNTNDITGAIRAAVEDSAVTYTLGFYIDRASVDGKFHEVKVEVKRKDVNVRYPNGYFALRDLPASDKENKNTAVTAVQSPLESSTIPVQIKVGRLDRILPSSYGLSGSIDLHHLRLAQNGNLRSGAVDVLVIEQDGTGKVLRESHNRINLHLTDEKYAAYLQSGIVFSKYVPPLAGVATLRIVVEDPSSADIGSLIIPLSRVN